MILTPEQIKSFAEAAKPLIKWMNENCHPHCEAFVNTDSAALLEGIARIKNTDLIKD